MSDARLNELFVSLNENLPAAEFRDRVLRRIERAARIRYVVLMAAAVLGLAIAVGPLLDLLDRAARELLDLIMTLRDADLTVETTTVVAVLFLALVPGAVRWLER